MNFGLRFDFRNPAIAHTTMAERYQAALDMAEWADRLGGQLITVSEHHGSDDGYIPSPVPMLAAMAARIPILQPLSRWMGPTTRFCPDHLVVWT